MRLHVRSTNAFSSVAVDQAIEQTMNEKSKTTGGIVGFSTQPGAVQQWVVNAHQRAEITENTLDMAGLSSLSVVSSHKEAATSRLQKDEQAVQSVLAVLSSWPNPFTADADQPLSNISSGVAAPADVSHDLLSAYDIGEKQLHSFVKDRLVMEANAAAEVCPVESNSAGDDPVSTVTPFHDPISKLKLKSFKSLVKASRVKVQGKDVIVRADCSFFSRLLVVAQSRAMDLREVFQYSLGPVPWSLATPDGQMAKTTKSTLLQLLEKDCDPIEVVPNDAVWVVDAMALLQSITNVPRTFGELAEAVFTMATTSFATHGPRVDLVCDQYPDVSITASEQSRRAASGSLIVNITHSLQKCPTQWQKFLSLGKNKMALIDYLINEWAGNAITYMRPNCNIASSL